MHSKHLIKLLGLTVLAAIGTMAVGASVAQAKYVLLLNGQFVSKDSFTLIILEVSLKAENGLKITCSGGTGNGTGELVESGKKVITSSSTSLKGCVWVGSEKTCTINDGGAGVINTAKKGELSMSDASTYVVRSTSSEFTTIITEGVFCTIPEEEVLSGTLCLKILEALADTKLKLVHLEAENLKLGNSKVTELSGEIHVSDTDPNATFGIHLTVDL